MTKDQFYFILANYFQIWAKMVLARWKPEIIAVVGSAGKTTTLYLLEKILQHEHSIKTSYRTNAATAIPLNILGLKQKTFSPLEWEKMILAAPFRSFDTPSEKVYLCEMDSDRSGEMKTHTKLIKPDFCCIPSLYPIHTGNFKGKSKTKIESEWQKDIEYAFASTKKYVIGNDDNRLIKQLCKKYDKKLIGVSLDKDSTSEIRLSRYEISLSGTKLEFELSPNFRARHELFVSGEIKVTIPLSIVSKANCYGVGIAILVGLLKGIRVEEIKKALENWQLPAGRMNLFAGKYATTIIDSSYNASKTAVIDALEVLKTLGKNKTIAVLGDMRELGALAEEEHKKMADEIMKQKIHKVVLIGPLMSKFVASKLWKNGYKIDENLYVTTNPQEAADWLVKKAMLGGETILVKGSQNTLYLEGLIEQILAKKTDVEKLCRRETMWQERREKIYL
jgi:UDP-N-acetylmuramoyl-tripeptide--D-alanyl-D-alanine ligase